MEFKITEYDLEPDPVTKYSKYNIWTNWYHYLNIDTSIYPPDINSWRKLCKKYKIKNHKTYLSKASEYGLPLMPEELYKIKSLIMEFNLTDRDIIM